MQSISCGVPTVYNSSWIIWLLIVFFKHNWAGWMLNLLSSQQTKVTTITYHSFLDTETQREFCVRSEDSYFQYGGDWKYQQLYKLICTSCLHDVTCVVTKKFTILIIAPLRVQCIEEWTSQQDWYCWQIRGSHLHWVDQIWRLDQFLINEQWPRLVW